MPLGKQPAQGAVEKRCGVAMHIKGWNSGVRPKVHGVSMIARVGQGPWSRSVNRAVVQVLNRGDESIGDEGLQNK